MSSVAVVVIGCVAGYYTPSVDQATKWITAALWGGYAAPNILKWHWWRMNGYGYFWGMFSGIAGAIVLLVYLEGEDPLMAFPVLLAVSTLGSVIGSLCTQPEKEEVLREFYTRTRPWGWWGPVLASALQKDPGFRANRDFGRDVFNVLVGVVWQTSFVVLPIYIVTRDWHGTAAAAAVVVATSLILKFTWYDRLESNA